MSVSRELDASLYMYAIYYMSLDISTINASLSGSVDMIESRISTLNIFCFLVISFSFSRSEVEIEIEIEINK